MCIRCVRIILVSVFPFLLFFKAVLILVYLQCLLLSEYRGRGDMGNAVRLWGRRWGVRKRETVDKSIPLEGDREVGEGLRHCIVHAHALLCTTVAT